MARDRENRLVPNPDKTLHANRFALFPPHVRSIHTPARLPGQSVPQGSGPRKAPLHLPQERPLYIHNAFASFDPAYGPTLTGDRQ